MASLELDDFVVCGDFIERRIDAPGADSHGQHAAGSHRARPRVNGRRIGVHAFELKSLNLRVKKFGRNLGEMREDSGSG